MDAALVIALVGIALLAGELLLSTGGKRVLVLIHVFAHGACGPHDNLFDVTEPDDQRIRHPEPDVPVPCFRA